MKEKHPPAFVLSGVSSGSGKTTVSLGLMAAFRKRGMFVAPFKCGPDFIDPGLHRLVTGTICRNLDLWMMGEDFSRSSFLRNATGADIAIIEGVMGMFDGGRSSSGILAKEFGIANILVLDVRSMAESAAAIVKGFESLQEGVEVAGVILNRIGSPRHLQLVTDAIRQHCNAEILGSLPRTLEFTIPSRHLGLLTAEETPLPEQAVALLAETVETHIDLDRILALCRRDDPHKIPQTALPHPQYRVAVARDRAFCFYYEDNLDLLQKAGAELLFFSPMEDRAMPEADALYLGGGYPELYARELAANHGMCQSIINFIEADGQVFAECGGFMYLTEGIENAGEFTPLLGIFPVRATMNRHRTSLGYRELTTRGDSFFGPPGTILRGHEFHYSSIPEMPTTIERVFSVHTGQEEGYRVRNVIGGYIHLHFGFSPQVVEYFLQTACPSKA